MKVKFLCANLLKCICIFLITSIFLLSDVPIIKGTKAKEILNGSSNVTYNTSEETELSLENEFATHYFSNLTDNFGVNILGSCGYIALGMLLGYYDSYWSDSFINENFEQKATLPSSVFTASVSSSPGGTPEHALVNDIVGNDNYKDGVDYLNRVVLQNYTQYLHFQLIKIGNDLKYYNKDGEKRSAGLSDSQIISLTEEYLYDFMSFNRNDIAIDYDQRKDNETNQAAHARISSFVVGKLLQGIPVLIASKEAYYGEGHVMIAYDYNWNTGTIYVHTGRREDNNFTHLNFEYTGYEHITMAMALDIRTNHSHTNNYKYNNTTYCPCSNQTFYQGKVVFENLYCLGTNATLLNNNVPTNYFTPITFSCFNPVDISHMSAQVTSYGYDPQCLFLGWYRDMDFTTKITTTPTNITGDCILYAKWRIDYGWISGNRSLTVNSVQQSGNSVDQICVGTTEMLGQMAAMGIKKISVVFYIRFWEVDDGRQFVYFYKNINDDDDDYIRWGIFNALLENYVDKVTVTFDIQDVINNPYIYVKYGTTDTDGADVWQSDKYHAEISYVAGEADITGTNAPPFTWYYDNNLLSRYNYLHPSNY